jgi:hypothetical protein
MRKRTERRRKRKEGKKKRKRDQKFQPEQQQQQHQQCPNTQRRKDHRSRLIWIFEPTFVFLRTPTSVSVTLYQYVEPGSPNDVQGSVKHVNLDDNRGHGTHVVAKGRLELYSDGTPRGYFLAFNTFARKPSAFGTTESKVTHHSGPGHAKFGNPKSCP